MVSRNQAIVAAVVLLALAGCSAQSNFTAQTAAVATNSVSPDEHTLGNPKAPITMIEYNAPSCPHCAHFRETMFPQVKSDYINTGKVFYILRVFRIVPADAAVESIAHCLPADRYFSFIDLALRNQKVWYPIFNGEYDRSALIKLATRAGLSADKADLCIADKDEQTRIDHVTQNATQRYSINAVPVFVINGTVVQATEADWPKLQTRFEALLSKP